MTRWIGLVALVVFVPGGLLWALLAALFGTGAGKPRDEDAMRWTTREREALDSLTPRFRAIVVRILTRARAEGLTWAIGLGYRTTAQQEALYRAYLDGGPRAAPPGSSAHEYREAIDVNLTRDGKVIQRIDDGDEYERFGKIIREEGGVWGGAFRSGAPDGPHIEHPNWRELRPAA